jgi:hypothetical protein
VRRAARGETRCQAASVAMRRLHIRAPGFTEQVLAANSHLLFFRLDAAHGSCRASRPGHADSRASGRGRRERRFATPQRNIAKAAKRDQLSHFSGLFRGCCVRNLPLASHHSSPVHLKATVQPQGTRAPPPLSRPCAVFACFSSGWPAPCSIHSLAEGWHMRPFVCACLR